MSESIPRRLKRYIRGAKNRILAHIARFAPGARTCRVWLHRLRGIRILEGAWLGYDLILETEYPELIHIGKNVEINQRTTIIAHFHGIAIRPKGPNKEKISVWIEDNAFIGPGVIILPNVTLGYGCVVTAGSVVTKNVPPLTVVQGNPAVPIAKCGIPLSGKVPYQEFLKKLKPYKAK